ncbi:MAG: flagellar biosynthesis anti-sigma factor FlgM [Actinobacteria bacterium]|nr:flagellar biosynthesis anti-sigma factor FlgM [Actinomycetota bacterium]
MDDENTTVRINELKAQIERAAYDVDVEAVAEAFVSRMLAVHAALRRADVRALVGESAFAEIRPA